MSKPSITNCPNTFFRKFIVSAVVQSECIRNVEFLISHQSLFTFACVQIRHNPLSGGYCGGVPPLPIPNREVKPTCADGTAMQCGRVGRRLLSMKSLRFRKISEAFLFVCSAWAYSNGCKSLTNPNSGNRIANSKGVYREVESERSWRQTSDLTHRNFIQGIWPWMRLQDKSKSHSYSEWLV